MRQLSILFVLLLAVITGVSVQTINRNQNRQLAESVIIDACAFETTGHNQYFILEPGYRLVLEGKKGNLVITVLNETKKIAQVETRVVEENESENGKLWKVSRSFLAFCRQTNSVYNFGKEVDIYHDGKIVNHEGAWIATGKNKAWMVIPGLILQGVIYDREIAPGIALDSAETMSTSETKKTPAGTFTNCLKTEETDAVEPGAKEFKLYAPGVGLIEDEDLLLTKYGFVKSN